MPLLSPVAERARSTAGRPEVMGSAAPSRWGDHWAGLAYRGAAAVARLVPRAWAVAIGRGGGELCWILQRERRRALAANWRHLARARRASLASSRRAFRRFGEQLVDTLRLAHAEPSEVLRRVEFVGLSRIEDAAGEKPIVLLCLHSGNWEWAGAALALRGFRVASLARRHPQPAERFFAVLRRRFGVETVDHLGGLETAGGCIAIFLDRPGARFRSTPERAARRVVALAARRGWTVAPCWAESLSPFGYRVRFGAVSRPGARAAERAAVTRAALRFLGRRLGREPDQWFAFEPLAGQSLGRTA